MSVQVIKVKQNTDAWLKEREGFVTGSNADFLLTKSLKETLKQNTATETRGSFYSKRGHILEEEAIEIYESIHEVKVERPGIVVNSKYPNAKCSPDGIDEEYLLEVKAFADKKHTDLTKGTIPFTVMAQLQFNMMICELKKAKLILYNPDLDIVYAYKEIEVKADKKIQDNMKNKLGGEK